MRRTKVTAHDISKIVELFAFKFKGWMKKSKCTLFGTHNKWPIRMHVCITIHWHYGRNAFQIYGLMHTKCSHFAFWEVHILIYTTSRFKTMQ